LSDRAFFDSSFDKVCDKGAKPALLQPPLVKKRCQKGVGQWYWHISEKVSVNGIDIFPLKAQDAAWLANYEIAGTDP